METIFAIIIFLILLAFIIILYAIFGPSGIVLPTYNNNVLDLIKTQESWGYFDSNGIIISPYIFKIINSNRDVSRGTQTGTMQISYFDSLGGYIQGIVNFNATYKVIDNNNIQINPTSVISTATKRWPQNQTWTLTFISNSNLKLNTGQNTYTLNLD